MQTKQRGLKKKVSAVTAALLVIALLLGGTYAWSDYRQHKTNEAMSHMQKYNVRLVEDFQEKDNWKVADGDLKKEIRVTNTGLVAKDYTDVYVRIQLKEYMEMAEMVIERTAQRYMIDTSGAFIYFATEAAAKAAYPNNIVKQLHDAVNDVTGWFVQTKEHDDNGQYGDYVTTKYALSDDVTHIMGTVRADKDAKKTEKHDVVADGTAPQRNGECNYPVHLWDGSGNPTKEYINWILNDPSIKKLSEWDGQPGKFWIIDDTAGNNNPFIYWGEALAPETSTADFLKAINLEKQPNGDFYYAIHTELQAVSLDELSKWTDAPGSITDAYISSVPGVIFDFSGMTTPITIKVGETSPAPEVKVNPDTASQTVTWKSSNPQIASVGANGVVTGIKEGTVTITATAANGAKSTYQVVVSGISAKVRLEQLLDDISKMDPDAYTPATWAPLADDVITANDLLAATPAASDNELESIIADLMADIAALEADGNALQELIDDADAILGDRNLGEDKSAAGTDNSNPYTPDSLDAIQNARDEAAALVGKTPPATKDELKDALDAIQNAIDDLANKASKGDLSTLLSDANSKVETDHTPGSWGPFDTALDAANAVLNNPNATQTEVDTAKNNLQTAMDALQVKSDKSTLNAKIAEAEALTPADKYTAGTWTDLQTAITNAKSVANNPNAAASEITSALNNLQAKIDALVDLSALKAVIADANGRIAANYTPASWAAVTAALTPANTAANRDNNKSQSEVDTAKNNLQTALDGLVSVATKGSLEDAINVATGKYNPLTNYTTASLNSSQYEAKLASAQDLLANLNDGNSANDPSAADIKTAVDAMNTAGSQLVLKGNSNALDSLIGAIQELNQSDYSINSWNTLQAALTPAAAAKAGGYDMSASEINALYTALNTAKNNLVNVTALRNAIASATADIASGLYNDATVSTLQAKIADGNNLLARTDAYTAANVTSATTAITGVARVLKPVVSSIAVTDGGNSDANVANGANIALTSGVTAATTRMFTANVTGNATITDKSNWSIVSQTGTGATPTALNGSKTYTLNIPANYEGVITVKAASVDDANKFIQFTVTVTKPGPAIPASGEFTDSTGVIWRVLAIDADGNKLMVTKNVYSVGTSLSYTSNTATYNNGSTWAKYESTTTSGTALKGHMNTWYSNYTSAELKAVALMPTLGYESDSVTSNWSTNWNEDAAISKAGAVATGTADVVFPLSISEISRYIGTGTDVRKANDKAGTTRGWWTRSPGKDSSYPVSYGDNRCIIDAYSAMNTGGFRPAIWVKSN